MTSATNDTDRWELSHIDSMLSPKPLHIETGISRLASGVLMVSIRTDLHGCKGRMLEWWFKFFETSQHIRWWHPHDHVEHGGWDSNWIRDKNYLGATIRITQALAEIPPVMGILKFRDPKEIFTPALVDDAFEKGDISALVYARLGFGDQVRLSDNGDPIDGHMVQMARDTPYGCVLRSRFYLGAASRQPEIDVPDQLGLNLLLHCYTEFTYLSRFLPSLYYGEHANGEKAPLPW
ncbi:DAPG hydrolase family protein [Noviherbaspirillum denitrificans]|uniref:Hydrolase n=1 Tax=Noviherbaspirillum denitrificans TaxID=1968433 RepID=A0A254TN01_9BURK|nr:hydrolase [Noviherbaspirillum denitrificans]OWW22732.1 hydrolase [Noviherbaspirillum denitrificans]